MYGDSFPLVLVFGHYSSQQMKTSYDLCITVLTLETAVLDTPNKVAVLFTEAAVKRAPTICPL